MFDTWIMVLGSIDLRETGSLVLNQSLNLGSAFTFTSGGNILGCGHAIIMGGDLTLADTGFVRVLHVRNDLILDGQGKTFIVGDRAQLFVDSNVSLTLRHMTLRTSPKSAATPAIRLASTGTSRTLENVNIELGADFEFRQGQFYIVGDVVVSGTSALRYTSPMRSYITSHATLYFDYGTTLSVAPMSYTLDRAYTNNRSIATDFLYMADASSNLYLNGCTLKVYQYRFAACQGDGAF